MAKVTYRGVEYDSAEYNKKVLAEAAQHRNFDLMYQESLFNYRMGYGAAIATILFLIMDIYIAWFLYRLFKNEKSEK